MATEANDDILYELGVALFEPALENKTQKVMTFSETLQT